MKNLLKEVITPDILVVLVTILPKYELRLNKNVEINTKVIPNSTPPYYNRQYILSHMRKFC